MNEEIKQTIREKIASLSSARNIEFTDETDLFSAAILDSLGMIEFIQSLEKGFNIQFKNEDLIPQNFWSINAVSETVARYKAI